MGRERIADIKILHVIPSLTLKHGGTSASVRELCQGMASLDAEIHLWTTTQEYNAHSDSDADAKLKSSGVHLRYFSLSSLPWFGKRWAYSPALRAALSQELSTFDLVHIHTMWLYPTSITAQLCRRKKIPYLLSPCGMLDPACLISRRFWKELYIRLIERKTIAGAARFHFTSSLEKTQARLFGAQARSIVIGRCLAPEAISLGKSSFFQIRYPEIGNSHILLFLGRLHPIKRLDIIAQAFIRLRQNRSDVHLILAGPEDGSGDLLRRQFQESGISSHVTFTGQLNGEKKWAALQGASLLLLPSDHESFGMAALEAMAAGVPVLVSEHVGLAPEIVQSHAGSVLAQDPRVWAETIDRLLNDPAARENMGRAGRELVKQKFSSDSIARSMVHAYHSLVEQHRSGH